MDQEVLETRETVENQYSEYAENAAASAPETSAPETSVTQEAPVEEQEAMPRKKQKVSRRQRFLQNRSTHNVLLAGLFLLAILLVLVVNLAVKDRDFSEMENRNLAQRPSFSWTTLSSGSYFSQLESYYSDQFFLRDSWMSLKLRLESLMGRKDASGVFLGKEDYLLSTPEIPDSIALSRSITAINSFASAHPEMSVRMMLVPDAAAVLSDKLPKNAPVRDQLRDIQETGARLQGNIQFLNAAQALLEHKDEYIYYKTDHHWTTLGASYAFFASSGQMGIGSAVGQYELYTVTNSFEGTLAAKSGSHTALDSIQVYSPLGLDVQYYVKYPDSTDKICSIFRSDCLEAKDQYTVFFGGNHSKVEIDTTAGNERCLLVFKDSYANTFMQFLLPYFEKIIMIDPRYYYDDLGPIISSEGVTDILFLYSADTFFRDTSLADVLETG